MSKMDNLRAMREARYEATQKLAKSGPAAKASAKSAAATPAKAAKKPASSPFADTDEAPATEELCGHRNMSGRTCTREKGHAAKNHRYS